VKRIEIYCTLRDFLREEETSEERLPIVVDKVESWNGVVQDREISEISVTAVCPNLKRR